MSHFTVLVALGAVPEDQIQSKLATALQPFHEYESTGVFDDYVQFVSHDEQVRKDWAEKCEERIRLASGELIERHAERCYRPITAAEQARCQQAGETTVGWGFNKTLNCMVSSMRSEASGNEYLPHVYDPVGTVGEHEVVQVPVSQLYRGIEHYAKKAEGYEVHQGKIGQWTNPNRKWDWWVVGGRYKDRLLGPSGSSDICRKGDLRLDAMAAASVAARHNAIQDAFREIRKKIPTLSETEIKVVWRNYVETLPAALAVFQESGSPGHFWDWVDEGRGWPNLRSSTARTVSSQLSGIFGAGIPDTEADIDAWVASAPALSTFAFLEEDGTWHERGEMGWFAMVLDEKRADDWQQEFEAWFSKLDDSCVLVVVDCHI